MKKLKFLKNKLWLSSFALTTTGALVLAACGHTSTSTSDVSKPDDTTNKEVTPVIPAIAQASAEQKAVVNQLLTKLGFQAHLSSNIDTSKKALETNAKLVAEVGKINEDTVKASDTKLGKADAAPFKTGDSNPTVFAYLNKLKADFAQLKEVTDEQKTTFESKFQSVVTTATALTAEIVKLPKTGTANSLTDKVTAFNTAITTYLNATAENAKTQLSVAVKALADLETATNTITQGLRELIKAAFALDAAVTAIASYLNTDVAKAVEGDTSYSVALNAFVNMVRTDVLGTIGQDLWSGGQAPNGVEDKPSTLLYSVVNQVAKETTAFASLKAELQALSFSKALLLSDPDAVNLLALHVNDPVYLDVSRLNAYLIHADTDAVQILTKDEITKQDNDSTKTNLQAILNDLVTDTMWFQKYLLPKGEQPSQLSADLADALATADITEADKKPITDFQTAFNGLASELMALQKSFFDSESLTSFIGLGHNLVNATYSTNTAIGLAQNFGSVLDVVTASQQMEVLAHNFKNNLPIKAKTTESDKPETMDPAQAVMLPPAWVADFTNLKTKMDAKAQETDFAKAWETMGKHVYTTTGLAAKMEKIIKITTMTASSTHDTGSDSGNTNTGGDSSPATGTDSGTGGTAGGSGTTGGDSGTTEGGAGTAEGNTGTTGEGSSVGGGDSNPDSSTGGQSDGGSASGTTDVNKAPVETTPTTTYVGYLHKDVIDAFAKLNEWLFVKDPQTQLTPTLEKLIALAQKQLSPSQGSQTAQILTHLAMLYNNGQSSK